MTLIFDLNKALYFRFKSIMLLIEGENEITHVSSVLVLSLFQLCVFFLIMLIFNYVDIPFTKFSGGFVGTLLAALSILILITINFAMLKGKIQCADSIFFRKDKPTFVTDSFIVLVIFLMVFFSYINDYH